MYIPGLGEINTECQNDLIHIQNSENGLWNVGQNGVKSIYTPLDKKIEIISYEKKSLVYVKSKMGFPAIYPLEENSFEAPAYAVLMDLDGTSVHSEEFWMWVIEKTTSELLGNANFKLENDDIPHVSGHSVSEHLQYCINKYCPDKNVEQARKHYFNITRFELNEILEGRGKQNAFVPAPGLKNFLLKLKKNNIKIGLVTSGLHEKAWPEIVSAFRKLDMGDPLNFYDSIISAGYPLEKGKAGTLGELSPKPHPWLYAECARVGLGIDAEKKHRVVGIEDSAAGAASIRLAGFSAIGIKGGNIKQGGARPLLLQHCENFEDVLNIILK